MRLTWRDGVATLLVGASVAIYLAFLHGTKLWLISSAREATAALLVLGMAGCVTAAARDMYTGPHPQGGHAYQMVASLWGVTAFAAALTGIITGRTAAVTILAGVTVALWLAATVRHAFTAPTAGARIPASPLRSRDNHEVIHQGDATRP